MTVDGTLTFSESDTERLRALLAAQTFPLSKAALEEVLGFSTDSLQRGLMATAGGGVVRNFQLSETCSLRLDSDLWDETGTLQGAHVDCSSDGLRMPLPDVREPFPDRTSALAALALTPADLDELPRCGVVLAGLEPTILECFRLDAEQDLLLQTTEGGVAIATRPHVD